MTTKQGDGTR